MATSQLSVKDPIEDPIAARALKVSRWSENTGKIQAQLHQRNRSSYSRRTESQCPLEVLGSLFCG